MMEGYDYHNSMTKGDKIVEAVLSALFAVMVGTAFIAGITIAILSAIYK